MLLGGVGVVGCWSDWLSSSRSLERLLDRLDSSGDLSGDRDLDRDLASVRLSGGLGLLLRRNRSVRLASLLVGESDADGTLGWSWNSLWVDEDDSDGIEKRAMARREVALRDGVSVWNWQIWYQRH